MIKEIVTDTQTLAIPCVPCIGKEHEKIVKDLIDTAEANRKTCVGLAANQIGYNKRVIVVLLNDKFIPFVNPVYVVKTGGIKKEKETCLSFPGKETIIRRYKKVKINCKSPVTGSVITTPFLKFEARVVQHEMDHLEGVLI